MNWATGSYYKPELFLGYEWIDYLLFSVYYASSSKDKLQKPSQLTIMFSQGDNFDNSDI